jgi:two-component system sensor histidine kinase HydH
MTEFICAAILALLPAAAVATALLCRKARRNHSHATVADLDGEMTRLAGELAHEIRNPLSTIKVNLKLTQEALTDPASAPAQAGLSDQYQRELDSALRKITVVQKETDRLEQILDGFLRYVRRPDLQLATVDLNELVGDMIDFYSPQAHSHSLTMRHSLTGSPLMCRMDPGALKQVLLNLFINAQQAMEGGGELMIRTSRRGGVAVLQINDTGKGISPERLPTIFRPYSSSRSGGTGLGLATAKKIIEAHQGMISIHSELGKGTSFTIELPLETAGVARETTPTDSALGDHSRPMPSE